jgi:hypothetical protein
MHRRQRLQQSGGVDLLSVADMISSVQAEKQALQKRLGAPNQYGDLAGQLFNTHNTQSWQLVGAVNATQNPSRDRLRDKVQRKLLQVQLEIIQQDNRPAAAVEYADKTDVAAESDSSLLPVQNERLLQQHEAAIPSSSLLPPPVPSTYNTRLVWATAGSDAAAGHGNLAEESYTNIMQEAASPVFGAVGIELTTRNYGWAAANGADKSAPELALCLDSVYGTDVDILAWDWDFEESWEQLSQLTQPEREQREQQHAWRRHMFWARAALQANRPAVVAMNLNDVPMHVQDGSSDGSSRHPILRELDQLGAHGLTALGWNPAVMARIHDIIPDAARVAAGR